MKIIREKLLESPDYFNTESLIFDDPNAYAFGVNDFGEIKVKEEGSVHSNLSQDYYKYHGRIWLRPYTHVISFWSAPPKYILENIIKQLNNHFQEENITTTNLILEILKDENWRTFSFETYPEDFDSIENKEIFRIEHDISPLLKRIKNIPIGVGSKKYASKKPLPWQQAMLTSESQIVKSTINESPDVIKYGSDPEGIWHDAPGTYGFGWIDGKLYVSKESETHDQMSLKIPEDKKIDDRARKNFNFAGRVFTKQKIISFWVYPENQKDLFKLTKILDNALKTNISTNSDWKIEVSKKIGKRKDPNFKFVRDFIPLNKYISPGEWSKEEFNAEHVKSPGEKKKKKVPAGLGSKKYALKKPLPWQQAMYTESYYLKLNENPNAVIDPKVWEKRKNNKSYSPQFLTYNQGNSIPFGFYGKNKKLLISKSSKTIHIDLLNKAERLNLVKFEEEFRKRSINSGRLFQDIKVITFWNFPKDYNELIKVLKSLEKETKINILNDPEWKVEIPAGEFKNALDSDKSSWGSWYPRIGHQDFISIKDYKGGFQRSEDELAQQHVLSPMDLRKNKKIGKSWGKSKSGGLKRLKWRQAMYAESYYPRLNENKIMLKPKLAFNEKFGTNFRFTKKEDGIYTSGLQLIDMDFLIKIEQSINKKGFTIYKRLWNMFLDLYSYEEIEIEILALEKHEMKIEFRFVFDDTSIPFWEFHNSII